MINVEELKEELKDVEPKTVIMIRGYVNSKGDKRDLEVELLEPGAYMRIVREDLRILQESDVADLYGDGDLGDLQLTDMIAARQGLIEARQKSISDRENKTATYRGPEYVSVGPSTAILPDNPEALYLRGVEVVNGAPTVKPAKGAIPRAKQQLAEKLDLPSRYYLHNVKLEAGKCEEVLVFVKAKG